MFLVLFLLAPNVHAVATMSDFARPVTSAPRIANSDAIIMVIAIALTTVITVTNMEIVYINKIT